MLAGLRSLFESPPETGQEPFGLARLFQWQREERLKKKKQQQEEEELMVLLAMEL